MRKCLATIGVAFVSSAAAVAQPTFAGRLVYGVAIADYVRPIYVDGPSGPVRYLFFQEEHIALELGLHNSDQRPYAYRLPEGGLVDLLSITAVKTPAADARPRITVVSYAAGPPGMARPQQVPATLEIQPQDVVEVRAILEGVSVPGLYEVRIVPTFRDALLNSSVIGFEIRLPRTRADRAEIVHRRMVLALESGDCQRAEAETVRLLDIHQFSSTAYQVQAECAERAGKDAEAAMAYDRARELLLLRLDDLLVAHAKPGEIAAICDRLLSAANRVRAKGKKERNDVVLLRWSPER